MKSVLVSVIIATFNSAKYLDRVLESIRNQSIDQLKIEILVIDGGSNDRTLEIATHFGCKIINNPKTEPVYAKYIGLREALGEYIVYIDHDEVLTNSNSFTKRIELIESQPNTFAAITSGYVNPKGFSELNNYINDFGDPFSFFIYRLSKREGFFEKTLRNRYEVVLENSQGIWFDFTSNRLPIIELCAAASIIVASHAKRLIDAKAELIPHVFYLGLKRDLVIVFSKNDNITHYSVEKIVNYLHKIAWRIMNNIYHVKRMGVTGFTGRQVLDQRARDYKKYLFIFYAFIPPFSIIDSIQLSYSRGSLIYLIHTPLVLYTASVILLHQCLFFVGFKRKLRSYDGRKIIV